MRTSLLVKLCSASLCALVACGLPQSLAQPHEVGFSPVSHFKPVSALVVPKVATLGYLGVVDVPAPPVAVKPTVPVSLGGSYHGTGDYYLDKIVQFESSGNQYAVNSIGACGLFQALPCSKLGCALSDVVCQISWGRQYVGSVYGSSAAAWAHELAFHWY